MFYYDVLVDEFVKEPLIKAGYKDILDDIISDMFTLAEPVMTQEYEIELRDFLDIYTQVLVNVN